VVLSGFAARVVHDMVVVEHFEVGVVGVFDGLEVVHLEVALGVFEQLEVQLL